MQTFKPLPNFPSITVIQPEEYYHFVTGNPNLPTTVIFVEDQPGHYTRENCPSVDCSKCPLIELANKFSLISSKNYEHCTCVGIDSTKFIKRLLTPPHISKPKELTC